jgi:peptide deformylase
MNRPVIQYPNPILRQVSKPVEPVDLVSDDFKQLVTDLRDTVANARGAAISAVQIGVLKRVVVLHPEIAGSHPDVLINPVLTAQDGAKVKLKEGCLSIRGVVAEVERYPGCTINAIDLTGAEVALKVTGDLAQALHHELEHLDGKLLLDNVGPVKREMIKRRTKARKGQAVVYGQTP